MKLAVDVHFGPVEARVVGVAFEQWDEAEPTKIYTARVEQVEKKVRGELDLRGLSCVLQLLREHALTPDVIVIDGFVHLDAQETAGLGQHLYQALDARTAVIGVSKSAMAQPSPLFELHREDDAAPLTVTSAGIDIGAAKARMRSMHGRKRVPTLIKLAARLARQTDA